MKKRFITLVLALALVLGSVYNGSPIPAFAANKETQEQLTSVILKVKTKLELPEEYTEFSYDYNNYGSRASWYFYWSTADSSKSVNVNCDDEAHITNISYYSNGYTRSVPDKTSDELLGTAEELLARVIPEAKGHVVLKSTSCVYYRSAYQYRFNRMENGIEMPDNYVIISVSYENGELISFSSNWNYTAKVPAASNLIGFDDAKAKIDKKLDMKLQYFVTWDTEGKEKVFLAYTPSMSYIAANATSGKIYTKKTYWGADPEYGNMEEADAALENKTGGRGYEASLSDAEIKRIGELNNLISSDDAVKLIKENKYLLVDENANSVTANLRESDGRYFWNITLRDVRPEDYEKNDYYRAYASATIDAANGRILSFYASVKSLYYYSQEEIDGIKFNFSKKSCRTNFEDFVKSIEPEKFGQTKLSSSNASMRNTDEKTGSTIDMAYEYYYTRYNDGVPFASNGISGSVDRVTGKVYSYNVNWTEAEVPSAKGAISEAEAFDAYMGFEGFDLVYELVNKYDDSGSMYGYDNEQTIRLVYRTAISPSHVDAFTGKQLNYNGEEYEKVRTDYRYNDISGTKYEKAIRILAEMGVGLPGENFEPDKKITKEDLGLLISKLPYGYNSKVSEALTGEAKVAREDAAKTMVTLLGLEFIAGLDIYKLTYKDAADVTKGYEGFIALAGGLGLLGDKTAKNFKPHEEITRGEAAELLLRTAAVLIEGK